MRHDGGAQAAPQPPESACFSDLVAATIHDMKNSLGLVLDTLEEIDALAGKDGGRDRRLGVLRVEAKKINNKLIQLLGFYKMSHEGLPINPQEHEVAELLLESVLRERALLEMAGIEAELEVDESLLWTLDRELLMGVLGNAIGNALRHARSRLHLTAREEGAMLCLRVNDDGPGFPESLLREGAGALREMNFASGNTGLGLSFCAMIAALHGHGGRHGRVVLSNGGPLGGACFELMIP